ncbi:hypothetical protein HBB16_21575 [Pseudonocardia sp. MCCB 268]|nr:hypothetical protein [Pseudonocardia cytotoxica]
MLDGRSGSTGRRPARSARCWASCRSHTSPGLTVGDLVARGGTRTRPGTASGRPTTSGPWPTRWPGPGCPTSPTARSTGSPVASAPAARWISMALAQRCCRFRVCSRLF